MERVKRLDVSRHEVNLQPKATVMQDQKLREAADKMDLAIEAGERGDWPKAEVALSEAQLCTTKILRIVEIANDTERLLLR